MTTTVWRIKCFSPSTGSNTNHSHRFLSTEHETALIIEDDVDWNIAIRNVQIQRAEAAFSALMSPQDPATPRPANSTPDFWGASSQSWEILWLGHCGDDASNDFVNQHPHLTFADESVPPPFDDGLNAHTTSQLDNKTTHFLNKHNVGERTRMIYRSRWPLCTFAYAVTRKSAARILDTYGTGVALAYDVALLEACRDQHWLCYSITPELFHHVEAPSEIALINHKEDQKKEDAGPKKKKPTHNTACTARNIWVDEDDWRGRAWKMETVRSSACYLLGRED
jgi:hypothetical protein